jgi:pyridoxal phosphate enzyme (YggS family)
MDGTEVIRRNYSRVREQIDSAARSAGRDPAAIRLLVVTKGHPVEAVQQAVAAGIRLFGENYVEEAVEKMQTLAGQGIASSSELEWHMIGHLQSRKVRQVCEHFTCLHSLDSLKLAERLDHFAEELGRKLPVLLECNVSAEQTKFGYPVWREDTWQELAGEFSNLLELPHLQVRGLMTMAPFFDEAEPARPYFLRLRRLQSFLIKCLPQTDWGELSMGMSGDFTVAVQEGATLVRVGTAIMGARAQRIE